MTVNRLLLWEHPLSPFAQKVKIALREKGLEFDTRIPRGFGSGAVDPDFAAVTPLAQVPVLVDGALSIFESKIILEYLEEKHPKPDLMSDHPPIAAKARMIQEMCDSSLDACIWAVFEIVGWKRASGEVADRVLQVARAELDHAFGWLETQLAGEWFCPPHFGLADLAVAPHVAAAIGFDVGPRPGSPLVSWFERASARDSVRRTLEEGRAAAAGMSQLPQALASGKIAREYAGPRLDLMLRAGAHDLVQDGLRAGTIRLRGGLLKTGDA